MGTASDISADEKHSDDQHEHLVTVSANEVDTAAGVGSDGELDPVEALRVRCAPLERITSLHC